MTLETRLAELAELQSAALEVVAASLNFAAECLKESTP